MLLRGRGLCINPRDPRSSAAVTASVTLYPGTVGFVKRVDLVLPVLTVVKKNNNNSLICIRETMRTAPGAGSRGRWWARLPGRGVGGYLAREGSRTVQSTRREVPGHS